MDNKNDIKIWNDKYLTGNSNVDEQHKNILKLVEDFGNAIEHGRAAEIIDMTLGQFALYVVKHFDDEEKLMLNSTYPYYDEHRKLHQQLIIRYSDFLDKYHLGDATAARSFFIFIKNWLDEHVLIEDKKLVDFLRQQQTSL